MLKIGIITFHDADNYGAVLQAYALTESIKSLDENAKVEIIDYKISSIVSNYKLFNISHDSSSKMCRTLISSIIYLPIRFIKKYKFNKFRKKNLTLSKKIYYKSNDIISYEIYIIGSDQVWNPDITRCDPIFDLEFCDETSLKISYAASIGKDNLSIEESNYIKKLIEKIDIISVRENNAKKIIKQLTNKPISLVLDPVFLLDSNEWLKVLAKKKSNERYILLYMITDKETEEETCKIADLMSKKMKLPVWYINISYKKEGYGFKHLRNVGPLEFLKLIYNAEFVVASSFHGTAFSIIFKKNFIATPPKNKSSRLNDLLSLLNLEERLILSRKDIDNNFKQDINYSVSYKILNEEINKSMVFLKDSIRETSKK